MSDLKLNILAVGVHPDDIELGCSGTLAKQKRLGSKIGVLDLTAGELGTRGNADLRKQEAHDAATVLELDLRLNLEFRDGFFKNDEDHQLEIIKVIRNLKPDIVLANAVYDRHPDHGRASSLTYDACFLSGLRKIETEYKGEMQEAWRPKAFYCYIQDQVMKPDFVVDISGFINQKMEAIKAYKSQFHNPDSQEPETYISSDNFLNGVEARAAEYGRIIGVEHAEGFVSKRLVGVNDLTSLV